MVNRLSGLAAAAAVMLMPGCNGEATGGAPTITVEADDNFFDPTEVEVPPGQGFTVELQNTGNVPHTFTVEELEIDTGHVGPGRTVTVDMPAITESTRFICTIHIESDKMKGELQPRADGGTESREEGDETAG